MSIWKPLVALVGTVGPSGMSAGEPPINPLVEGREPNPVVREYCLPETPIGGYVAGSGALERSNRVGWLVMTNLVWEYFLDQFTVPLGTAVAPSEALDA